MIKRITTALFATLCLMAFSTAAFAAVEDEAKTRLETSINKILDTLKKPEFKDNTKNAALVKQVEDEIFTIFDFTEFSARTVGPAWNSFSDDQKSRFTDAFADLLRATYLSKFTNYNGEKIVYNSARANNAGDKVEIATTITLNDGKNTPVPISYRMLKKTDWVIYDIVAEGVSLVQNYRSQFQEILTKNSPDELIVKVKEKTEQVKKQK